MYAWAGMQHLVHGKQGLRYWVCVCLLSVCYLIFYLQWQPAEEKVIPTNLMLQWLNYEIVLERCAYIALELRLLYRPGRYHYRSQCAIRHTWSQLSQSDGILHLP